MTKNARRRGALSQRKDKRLCFIVGLMLLMFHMILVLWGPAELTNFMQKVFAVISAVMFGVLAYALGGTFQLELTSGLDERTSVALRATGSIVVAFVVLWWWASPWALVTAEGARIYRVRVQVLDAAGAPADGVEVWSSVGGEAKQLQAGWEFVIPEATVPTNRQVRFRASMPDADMMGMVTVALGADVNPGIELRLAADTSGVIRGEVVDEAGVAVRGARVWVSGRSAESTRADSLGGFALTTKGGARQSVELNVDCKGFAPTTQWATPGQGAARIVLTPEVRFH